MEYSSGNTTPRQPSSQNPLLVPRIIWGAILYSTVMYYFVLMTQTGNVESTPDSTLINILAVAAAVTLVTSFILPKFIFKSKLSQYPGPIDFRRAVQYYLPSLILGVALAEATCLYGFVAAFRHGIQYYYPFWALGALRMFMLFPTENGIMNQVAQLKSK